MASHDKEEDNQTIYIEYIGNANTPELQQKEIYHGIKQLELIYFGERH